MTEDAEKTITLTRAIDAPVEEVFAAWTDPALLEQWQADFVEFEAFEGGGFRFETPDEENPTHSHVVEGRVLSIEPERQLVELWQYRDADELEESTLVVTFRALDNGRTELSLTEIAESHADPESRIFSIEAWNAALEELAELLE